MTAPTHVTKATRSGTARMNQCVETLGGRAFDRLFGGQPLDDVGRLIEGERALYRIVEISNGIANLEFVQVRS
jgi:hypothetical protein